MHTLYATCYTTHHLRHRHHTAGSALGVSGCRFFHDNERFVAMSIAAPPGRKLVIWDRWQHALQAIGTFYPEHQPRWGDLRGPMVPMWSPSGDTVVFDGAQAGSGWQISMAGVADMAAAMLPRARHSQYPWVNAHDAPRYVWCCLMCER